MTLFRDNSTTHLEICETWNVFWTLDKNTKENVHKEYFQLKKEKFQKKKKLEFVMENEWFKLRFLSPIYRFSMIIIKEHNSVKYFILKWYK